MRMGSIIGAMLASPWGGLGLSVGAAFDPSIFVLSPASTDSGRSYSSGTRARRQWKRRRAAGITKRVRA